MEQEKKEECHAGWFIRIGKRRIIHFIGTLEDAARYAEELAEEGEEITIS